MTAEKDTGPIIRYDAPEIGGQLDEFIADNASIHFEAMGDAQFWISVTLADGRVFHINCGAESARAKGYARCDEDEPTIPPGGGMPDPASLTPEESARWAEALDGRPRVLPPGDRHTCRHCGGPLGDAFDSDDHTCRTRPIPPDRTPDG